MQSFLKFLLFCFFFLVSSFLVVAVEPASLTYTPYSLLETCSAAIIKQDFEIPLMKTIAMSVAESKNLLFVGGEKGDIAAFDLKTLEQKWIYKTTTRSAYAIEYDSKRNVLWAVDANGLLSLDAFTGEVLLSTSEVLSYVPYFVTDMKYDAELDLLWVTFGTGYYDFAILDTISPETLPTLPKKIRTQNLHYPPFGVFYDKSSKSIFTAERWAGIGEYDVISASEKAYYYSGKGPQTFDITYFEQKLFGLSHSNLNIYSRSSKALLQSPLLTGYCYRLVTDARGIIWISCSDKIHIYDAQKENFLGEMNTPFADSGDIISLNDETILILRGINNNPSHLLKITLEKNSKTLPATRLDANNQPTVINNVATSTSLQYLYTAADAQTQCKSLVPIGGACVQDNDCALSPTNQPVSCVSGICGADTAACIYLDQCVSNNCNQRICKPQPRTRSATYSVIDILNLVDNVIVPSPVTGENDFNCDLKLTLQDLILLTKSVVSLTPLAICQ